MNDWQIAADDVHPDDWPDAADLAQDTIQRRLDAAQRACATFAPSIVLDGLTLPDDLPPGWALAVVYQARNIHDVTKRTGDSLVAGPDAYPIRIRPLTDAVKALLRPQSGRPAVG